MTEPSLSEPSHASEHEPPPPEPENEILEDRKKRSKGLLIGITAVVVLAGGSLFALLRFQEEQNTAAMSRSWSAFSRCVMGPSLDEGEVPSLRFRNVQLTAMMMTDQERTAAGSDKPWPMSCTPLGHVVQETWKSAGRTEPGGKDLGATAESLAKALREPNARAVDLSEMIDATWAQAKKAGIKLINVDGPSAPAMVKPLDAGKLAKGAPISPTVFTLKAAFTDAHPAGVMRLLVEEKNIPKVPFLCTFAQKEAKVECKSLPSSVAGGHGLRLWGTADDDSAPVVFAGERGRAGIFRADSGEKIDTMYSYGGYAQKDGATAALGFDEETKDLILTRHPAGGKSARTKIDPDFRVGNYYYSTQILWDHVVLRGVTKENERRLFVSRYAWQGDAAPSLTDIGELPEPGLVERGADEPAHIQGCKTAQTMVVRVKGYDNDFMSFLVGGKWSPPMSPKVSDGILSCHGTEAVVTRLYPPNIDKPWTTAIAQSQCTTAGCTVYDVSMEKMLKSQVEFAPRDLKVDAVDLDGKLLVVWAAGERGGVRMRFAKASEFEAAKDTVLFDDLVKDGQVQKLSTLFGLRLFSRDGYAILLLSTVSGVYAIRIDAGGLTTPVEVVWT
jgi:hypothetical protein